jgi:hypothetical protein
VIAVVAMAVVAVVDKECGFRVWFQSVVAECGCRVWLQSVVSECELGQQGSIENARLIEALVAEEAAIAAVAALGPLATSAFEAAVAEVSTE